MSINASSCTQTKLSSGESGDSTGASAPVSMIEVSALYVATNGCYFGLPGVDPWDKARDATKYRGHNPVVAHPDCSRWCQLAYINQKRYGHKVGDDGGQFQEALWAVRNYGGVLEHPAFSYAWPAHGLRRPTTGQWGAGDALGWVAQVSQGAYGHRARKLTWLYYIGPRPFELDWSVPKPSAQVSFCKNHGNSPLPRLSKKEAKASPLAFRDMLLALARHSQSAEQKETNHG